MELFKLVGSIFVDSDEANKSISKTDSNAQSLGESLAKGVSTAGKWGMAIAGGAAAAGAAVVGLATDAAGTADTIDKASIRMGVSAEYYQELAYAAGQCGVETSALEKAAKKLEGTDLNMEDAMAQVMAFETAEERAAAAAELFGDSVAYQMAPLLQEGAEGFDGLRERAKDLGLVMSGDSVKAGVKLGDTISDIKQSLKAMVTSIGSAVLPMVQKFADMIIMYLPLIQNLIGGLIPVIASLADTVLPPLMSMAEMLIPILIDLFGQLMPVVTEIIQAVLPVLVNLLGVLLPPLVNIISEILPVLITFLQAVSPLLTLVFNLLTPVLNVVLALITPLVELASKLLQPIITLVGLLISTALKPLEPLIQIVSSLITDTLYGAFEGIKPIISMVTSVFQGLIDFITNVFTGNWKGAWESIVNMFSTIFAGIVEVAKKPLNAIISLLNGAIDGFNSIKIPDWVPAVGGKGIDIPHIPMLAEGGNVENAGMVMVGERGPELLNLPRGAKVSPLDDTGKDLTDITRIFVQAMHEWGMEFVSEVRNAIREAMQDAARTSEEKQGDTIIKIYLGDELLDEVIINTINRIRTRSGGQVNV